MILARTAPLIRDVLLRDGSTRRLQARLVRRWTIAPIHSLRELPEVVETDLNPVRCMTSGCIVLDMRMRIERRSPVERRQTW
jgi:hypothetical protein